MECSFFFYTRRLARFRISIKNDACRYRLILRNRSLFQLFECPAQLVRA